MKRLFLLVFLCLTVLLAGCQPIENGGGEVPPEPESYGELIGTFYVEDRNMTLRLMDITGLYQEVAYRIGAVPVDHTRFDELPTSLKETVKAYGLASPTQVYRMKWHGETVYHLLTLVVDEVFGVYKPSGERISFPSYEAYFQFLGEVSDVTCLLLINTEVVKSAVDAPNLLIGTWQTDWSHLHHNIGSIDHGSGIDEKIDLYPDLPFSLTEVCHFKKDGTGYLRTVKTFKNGKKEVALDPFTYYLTNYQTQTGYTSSSNFHNYSYICCFAAGDTIEYTARSLDDFTRVFDRSFYHVTYPWYKQKSDTFSNEKGDPKYGIPDKDKKSPIVGRWTGIEKSAALVFGIHTYTWVFRSDGTGYLLMDRQFNRSFAYTVEKEKGDELQLTLYKYDCGFTVEDGFWKEGDWTYSYVSQPTPKGQVMKARIYDNQNSLELEGWTQQDARQNWTPISFKRVSR